MPGKIFLSPIKPNSLPVPPAGRWFPAPDFLRRYSSDIPLEGQVEDRQLVQSVPTVFARPIQFYQALENAEHPAHASLVGQWRGLLAVFALQRWLEISIEVEEFSLTNALAGRSPMGADRGGADLPLLSILLSQLPHPAAEWEKWWLLRCEGELLGATTPWSLVYTPAEQRCPQKIPWQREGTLMDPVDYFAPRRTGRSQELALLAAWLDRVLAFEKERWGVADRPHLEGAMRTIVRELRGWRNSLRPFADPALGERDLLEGAALVREEPYRHFLQPLDIAGVDAQSDLLLDLKTDHKVLAFSRTELDPNNRVFGSVLAAEVDLRELREPTGEAGWRTRTGRRIPLPYLISEEVFFPPKLAQIELSDHALSFGDKRFALPLTAAFFAYFDLDALTRKRMLVEMSVTDTRVIVRLRLPLKGDRFLYVSREYDRNTEVVRVDQDTPALAFWPDFLEPDWRHNFALMSGSAVGDLGVAPLTSTGGTLPMSAVDGTERTFRIWSSPAPLLGFVLKHVETPGGTREAGVVLRQTATGAHPRGAAPWRVAVDFGTSSTNLLVQEGTADPHPLTLKNRTVVLTRATSNFEAELSPRLYPTQDVLPPFPTLLYRNEASQMHTTPGASVGDDFYTPRFVARVDDFLYGGLAYVVKDLKWAGRGGTKAEIPIREYLTALVRAICCEARSAGAKELALEWSFPLSLPASTKASMISFWQTTAGLFSIDNILAVRANPGLSESEALCRYLAADSSLPVLANSLSIAVDVGGGSTDIGFWTEGRLLGQVSLKLAGNDVLVPLTRLPDFWSSLSRVCDPLRPPGADDTERIKSNPAVPLNTTLTQAIDDQGQLFDGDPRKHPVPLALGSRLQRAEPPWSIARSLTHLFATGLTFYLGLHARKWMSQIGIKSVTVRFGGRGAAMLTWLDHDATLLNLIQSAFLEGISLDQPELRAVSLNLFVPGLWYEARSPLKGEVVKGLLLEPLKGETPNRQTTTIVGEIGWMNEKGEVLDWDAEVSASQLDILRPPPNYGSGYAAHFLSRVAPRYVDELGLDAAGLASIQLDLAKVQNHLRSGVADGFEILQPIFAVELKAIMEDYIRKAST